MNIKVLKSFHEKSFSTIHNEGDVIDVAEERAAMLIERGWAEEVKKKKTKKADENETPDSKETKNESDPKKSDKK